MGTESFAPQKGTESAEAVTGAISDYDVARAQALVAQVRSSTPSLEGQRRAAGVRVGRTSWPHALSGSERFDGLHRTAASQRPHSGGRRFRTDQTPPRCTSGGPAPGSRHSRHWCGDGGAVSHHPPRRPLRRRRRWAIGSHHECGPDMGCRPFHQLDISEHGAPRARVRQAKAEQTAALASFDAVVLTALKETEHALVLYGAALDNREALGDAQDKVHRAFNVAHNQFIAGALSIWTCSPPNKPWSPSMPPSHHRTRPSYWTKSPYSRRWAAAGGAKASLRNRRIPV
jgi:hypothetical protein